MQELDTPATPSVASPGGNSTGRTAGSPFDAALEGGGGGNALHSTLHATPHVAGTAAAGQLPPPDTPQTAHHQGPLRALTAWQEIEQLACPLSTHGHAKVGHTLG